MASESQENAGKRGPTTLRKLKRKKGTNVKYELQWNSKGLAKGKNKSCFMSYIGVCARTQVDINFPSWNRVPQEVKESIWTTILDVFEVPADKQDWVISVACERWGSFKSKLNRFFMYDKDGNICPNPPPLYPFINQEMWDKFTSIRRRDEFKEQSDKHQEISKKNRYPIRGSRKGYVGIEEEIIQEITENNSLGSPLNVSSSTPIVPRSLLRKKARIDKSGNLDEPEKQVADKMDSLSHQVANSEITLSGRDILTTALGTKGNAGRVRAAGVGVTTTGRDAPLQSSTQIVERLKSMEEQVIALKRMITELQLKKGLQPTKSPLLQSTKSLQSSKNLQSPKNLQSIQDRLTIEPWDAIEAIARSYLDFTEVNNNVQPTVVPQMQFPEGWSECKLASPEPGNPIVATGKVFNTLSSQPVMLHNKPLQPGHMKVTIIDPKVEDATLPIPDDEASTVFEAVGAFIAWPTELIFRNTMDDGLINQNTSTVSKTSIPAPKSQSTPLNPVIQRAAEITDDINSIKEKKVKGKRTQVKRTQPKALKTAPTIQPTPSQSNQVTLNQQEKLNTLTMKLMHRCARGMTRDDTITIDMPPTVWEADHKILITKDELLQWLFQESVCASHVSVYIKYLYNLCQEWGISERFVFLHPQILSPDANDAEDEEVQYIANAMKGANKNQIYFAPYNDGRHWMLCAIHPVKDQAYWLDPAGNEAHPYIKKVVQMAIRKFYFQKRRKKPRGKSQWFEIKCPMQPSDDDSGYYMLRYMQEIIEKRQDFIPEQYYEDSPAPIAYEQKHIDEIRDKWIEFVQNHMD